MFFKVLEVLLDCDTQNNKLWLNKEEQLVQLLNDTYLKVKFQAESVVYF